MSSKEGGTRAGAAKVKTKPGSDKNKFNKYRLPTTPLPEIYAYLAGGPDRHEVQ